MFLLGVALNSVGQAGSFLGGQGCSNILPQSLGVQRWEVKVTSPAATFPDVCHLHKILTFRQVLLLKCF